MFPYSRPLRFQLTGLLLRNADYSVANFSPPQCVLRCNIPLLYALLFTFSGRKRESGKRQIKVSCNSRHNSSLRARGSNDELHPLIVAVCRAAERQNWFWNFVSGTKLLSRRTRKAFFYDSDTSYVAKIRMNRTVSRRVKSI